MSMDQELSWAIKVLIDCAYWDRKTTPAIRPKLARELLKILIEKDDELAQQIKREIEGRGK